MKTRLIISTAVILTAISTFAVAGGLFTAPWRGALLQVEQVSQKNVADDVSVLLPKMQGIQTDESAYLDDDKAIYVSRPNDLDEKTSRKKVAINVGFVFDQQGSKVLFAKKVVEAGEENGWSTDLWVLNLQTGQEIKVSDSVSLASLSPSGEFIAVENPTTGGIDLFTGDGVFLKKIGIYGAFPLFSPDSKQIAYYKFASTSFTKGNPYDALGIVVYNLGTGEELSVTDSNEGGKPVAFSADGKKVYYNSIRTSEDSLRVVSISSHEVQKLPGNYDWRYFSVKKSALVSSDGKAMISSSESGIGMIMFGDKGEVSSTKILSGGTNPRWFKQDEILAYRAQGTKGKYWEFVSVK